ncbi:MAG: DUF2156 domain-containing protein [Candidatus Aenigmarchaeota archaeon]|nr:DUF2156 domain-containing protein [Candidatus Aenigmarchaeota archaeon]
MSLIDIPEYPRIRAIEIRDKPLFDKAFKEMQPKISEFTFTNLFVWGKARGYKVSRSDGHILVHHVEGGRAVFFSPIGPEPDRVILGLFREHGDNVSFIRVPLEVASRLPDKDVLKAEDRDSFDYVYKRNDLAELRGAKYYPKRSFAEKAMKYGPIILDDLCVDSEMHKFIRLEQEWCDLRGCDKDKALGEEERAIYALFGNKDVLGVTCVAVEIEGRVVAFALTEELNDETCVVHFEKADTSLVGMYQLVNREFARRVSERHRYINREQDLGIQGLRKAKLSYYPAFLVKKFNVTMKS